VSVVQYYRDLLAQEDRIESFRKALEAVVNPGDAVLDIGTGIGTFAFFAAAAGAGTVWAIDGDAIVHVAKTIGQMNGYDGQVQFLRGWVPDVDLPGRADVIVFEDFSPRLLDGRMFRMLTAVQTKYASATARYVPARATIRLAPLSGVSRVLDVLGAEERKFGIDWRVSRDYVANTVHYGVATEAMLAARPKTISTIDFSHPLSVDDVGGHAAVTLTRDAVVDGLVYWFDLELAQGISMSNAPGATPGSWGHCVLPIDPPLEVGAGDRLEASVTPEDCDGVPGWLRWEARANEEVRSGHEFRSFPASVSDLLATSPDAAPLLNEAGKMADVVLRLADGTCSIREMGRRVADLTHGTLGPREAERLVAGILSGKIVDGSMKDIAHG
jgi:protein arginine N-methyltransferase 1